MRVVLATDGSKNALAAAELVGAMHFAEELQVTVVSAIQIPDLQFAHGRTKFRAAYVAKQTSEYEAAHKAAVAALAANGKAVDFVIREGHPGKVILEVAKEQDADLIAIGAVGDSMLDYVLFGSTSNFVATHADRSVLVARPGSHARPGINFLVACDGSEVSEAAARELMQSGCADKAKVDLLSVVHIPGTFSGVEDLDEVVQETRQEIQTQLQPIAQQFEPSADQVTVSVVEADHVGREIIQLAEANASQVIVMGNTGRGLVASFLLGSASRYVLQHSHCSVWISRSRQN